MFAMLTLMHAEILRPCDANEQRWHVQVASWVTSTTKQNRIYLLFVI